VEVVPVSATLSGLDTSPGAQGEVSSFAASIEAAGAGVVLERLAVGFRVTPGLFDAVG
jgi:hypothetical protein